MQRTSLFSLSRLAWFLLPAGALLNACTDDPEPTPAPRPVAAFSYTSAGCPSACPVTFQNTSRNASTYRWNFGDGTQGTQAEAKFAHSFAQPGTYRVKLAVSGAGGTDTTSRVVVVSGPALPGCAGPAVVDVAGTLTQPTTWLSCKVYVVHDDVRVANVLTIQPGTVVKFKTASSRLTLNA
ncbi:MAG TPA: PKD domain-containing protein, partial [Hymenobacter sp.]